jgi:hypothetical protein
VTGDRALAREAKDAVDEVSWLMARSPHGMESWFFALEALFEFEDRYGKLPLEDTPIDSRHTAGRGAGGFSSKVNGGGAGGGPEQDEAADGSRNAESVSNVKVVSAGGTPVRVEAVAVEPKVVRGGTGALVLRISVVEGWHLQGPDGLRIEAWGGSEFTFEETAVPAPLRLPDSTRDDETGWLGTFEATLSFSLSRKAARGRREITVRVAHRACGEGACRPEAVLSLSVPVKIV